MARLLKPLLQPSALPAADEPRWARGRLRLID
jgi:hypothetical protein